MIKMESNRNKYTNKEIQSNINILSTKMEQMKLDRTEITKQINQTKKQIQYWLELDESQLKLL